MKTNPENPVKRGITALVPVVKSIVSIVMKNTRVLKNSGNPPVNPVKKILAFLSLTAFLSATAATGTIEVETLEADTVRIGVIAPAPANQGGLVFYLPFEYDWTTSYYYDEYYCDGYYPKIPDAVGYGYGTFVNSSWASSGRFVGGAEYFNGEDSLIVLQGPDFSSWNTYSISVWVKCDDLSSGGDQMIIGNSEDSLSIKMLYSGEIQWRISGWNTTSDLRSVQTILDGQWHHIVAVNDNTTAQLWIDGILNDSTDNPDSVSDYSGSYLCVGGILYYYGEWYQGSWKGLIDEIRIYDRALLPGEILQLYTHGTMGLSITAVGDLTVNGNLTVTGPITFAGGAFPLKPLGNLSSGVYGLSPPVPDYSVWFDPMDEDMVTLGSVNTGGYGGPNIFDIVSIANKGSDGGTASQQNLVYPVPIYPVVRDDATKLLYSGAQSYTATLAFPPTGMKTAVCLVNTFPGMRNLAGIVNGVVGQSVQAGIPDPSGIHVPNIIGAANSGDFGWNSGLPVRVRDTQGAFWAAQGAGRRSPFGKAAFCVRSNTALSIDRILGSNYFSVLAAQARVFLDVGVGDIIVFPTVLTDQEAEEAVDWLWAKWGGSLATTKYLVADGEANIGLPEFVLSRNGDIHEFEFELIATKPIISMYAGYASNWGYGWGLMPNGGGGFRITSDNFPLVNTRPIALNKKYIVKYRFPMTSIPVDDDEWLSVSDGNGNLIEKKTLLSGAAASAMGLGFHYNLYGVLWGSSPTGEIGFWLDGIGYSRVRGFQNGVLMADCVPVEKGSTTWSPTPAPSNCFWDKVTGAYRVQTQGTGSFSIVELAD